MANYILDFLEQLKFQLFLMLHITFAILVPRVLIWASENVIPTGIYNALDSKLIEHCCIIKFTSTERYLIILESRGTFLFSKSEVFSEDVNQRTLLYGAGSLAY